MRGVHFYSEWTEARVSAQLSRQHTQDHARVLGVAGREAADLSRAQSAVSKRHRLPKDSANIKVVQMKMNMDFQFYANFFLPF
jgi:hypothetical protein